MVMRKSRLLVDILMGALVLIVMASVSMWFSRPSIRAPVPGQSADPCAHLAAVRRTQGLFEREDWSVASFVQGADTVAKVEIQQIDASRFDTPSGDPPTALPTTATDEQWEEYDDTIYAAVVLQATTIYSGPQVTGYIVPRFGGTTAACPNYMYESDPQIVQGSVGDSAIVYLYDQSYTAPIPPWFQHLETLAAQLSTPPSVVYRVMMPYNWYRYVGTDAVNSLRSMLNLPVGQLEAEVDAATP